MIDEKQYKLVIGKDGKWRQVACFEQSGETEWGNITGTLSDQSDLQNALSTLELQIDNKPSYNDLNSKQDSLISGSNIKTINNNSILDSGNIEINSGVWGNITGTLSNQTDLQNTLNGKVNSTDLASSVSTLISGGVSYTTTAPTSNNTDGLKFAILTSDPETKYDGWFYIIVEA